MRKIATRHPDDVSRGIEGAREVLEAGDAAIAAFLLDEPVEAVERIAGHRQPG